MYYELLQEEEFISRRFFKILIRSIKYKLNSKKEQIAQKLELPVWPMDD